MKVVLFLLLLGPIYAQGKKCSSGDDCDEKECCIVRGLSPSRKGDCMSLAKEGESCTAKDHGIGFGKGKFSMNCPCLDGLNCEPKTVGVIPHVIIMEKNLRCVVSPHENTIDPDENTVEPDEEDKIEEPNPEDQEEADA